jgi:putative transcriptional regulator
MFLNKLLVAKPFLKDPVFGGRVILIAKHDDAVGTEGFILNGPVVGTVGFGEITGPEPENPQDPEEIKKIIEAGAIQSAPLYMGGPCASPGLFMIHGYNQLADFEEEKEDEFEIGNTLADMTTPDNTIIPGVYYGNPGTMVKIVMDDLVKENKFRFFNGMAGWSPGQLQREIEAGAWDVIDATADVVFDLEAANKLIASDGDDSSGPSFKLPPTPFWN